MDHQIITEKAHCDINSFKKEKALHQKGVHKYSTSVKIFADGADLESIIKLAKDPGIQGFTTNPTLVRQAGIDDYWDFCMNTVNIVNGKPISFEVLSDDLEEMERQAKLLSTLGPNVYIKIPVTNTSGIPTFPIIKNLTQAKIPVNVTGICTLKQVEKSCEVVKNNKTIISVFAGRIADTGRNPVPIMKKAKILCSNAGQDVELLWASPRELLNIKQAEEVGCDIITLSPSILKNLHRLNKDLETMSIETIQMFRKDVLLAGYRL
ncbi:MAG: transaldolase family protein [bacterium]